MTDINATTAEPTPAATIPEPVSAGADATSARSRRKSRVGTVISTKMDKTAIVSVTDKVRHDRYSKTIQRTVKLYAHDESNEATVGDRVRVTETRPLSKLKRWRLVEIVERAR